MEHVAECDKYIAEGPNACVCYYATPEELEKLKYPLTRIFQGNLSHDGERLFISSAKSTLFLRKFEIFQNRVKTER